MSNRQVRRQASGSALKVPAKRARYSDASTSQSNSTNQQLTPLSTRSFSDGSGNRTGSAHKELGSYGKDDVQMPLIKIPRADLSVLKSEKASVARRPSARNERPFRKDTVVKRSETTHSGPATSRKSAFEGNAGSSDRSMSKQQTSPGQHVLPSKRTLDFALRLKPLDASKASPFSLTAQFHKVMESISNSESLTSMRRKKLSARKSTSSRSSVSFKAFPEMGRSKSDNLGSHSVDNSSPLSSPPRHVVAVDEEVSFSLPAEITSKQDPKQSTVSYLSGSSSQQLEGVKAKGEKVHQMAARKAYPYQINSRNERTSGKQNKISPFIAARKSAPYSQKLVNQKYAKTHQDRRASTSVDHEISSNNVQSQKRPTAARKSYPAAMQAEKVSRDSVPYDTGNWERITAARKSYPAAFNTRRGYSGMGSRERPVAARKTYPASIKTGKGSQDNVSGDKRSQERHTAARKSYPAALKTGKISQKSFSSDITNEKQRVAARKSYPHSTTAKIYSGPSDRYLSLIEQHKADHQQKTALSDEKMNVTKTATTSLLTVRKTDPYRMTVLGKQTKTTQETAKSPTTVQLKARRSDPYGVAQMRKKIRGEQKSARNTSSYDVALGKQQITSKTDGKSPSVVLLSGNTSEAKVMDVSGKQSGVISKTTTQSPLSSNGNTGKTDPCQQTPTNRESGDLVQKATVKSAPGSFRTEGKSDVYKMSDRGKTARKRAPYQHFDESGTYETDQRHKSGRKSVSRRIAREKSPELYGAKMRTGQCSVPLIDAARNVAISVGAHFQFEGTPSGSGSARDGKAEKGSEKSGLHQEHDRTSGEKKDSTKPISCPENTEVDSRRSRRRPRRGKTTSSPTFDFEETTEEEREKFHIVTLGHSSVIASPLAIPRSKYARQSLQSTNTVSHHHRRESLQLKQKSSQKEEKSSRAERQRNTNPLFSKKVSYESKPSVGCKVNEGWKVLSIGEVTHKKVSQKKKGRIHSAGQKKSQAVDSDEASDVDLSSSWDGDDDGGGEDDDEDDDGVDDDASSKGTSSNPDKILSKEPKSEADEPSCQDRNIFDMFKIPLSIKATSTFPVVSLEKKSNPADDVLETGSQATTESSQQTASEVISLEEDTLISESSMVTQEEAEMSDRTEDTVQSEEDSKESDSSDVKSIEKLKDSEPKKDTSFSSQLESIGERTLTDKTVSSQVESVGEGVMTDHAKASKATPPVEEVKEPVGQSEDNVEVLLPSRKSKGQKGDIAKESSSGEVTQMRGNVTTDPEVVYTSLRRMTRSERERIKTAERDVGKVKRKEVEVVIKKIPAVIGNETFLEPKKKEETSSLQEDCAEQVEKTCTASIDDDQKGTLATKEQGDRNELVPSKPDEGKDAKDKSPDKNVGNLEEMSEAEQLQEEMKEQLQGTSEDDSDVLGEAIADFLDNKDIDRIDIKQSSDDMSESYEEKKENREEEISTIQRVQNAQIVLESGKEELTNIQDEENIATNLEEESTLGNIGKESKQVGDVEEPSLDLSETEDEEEEDDSRNIFAIFQKAEKEVMLSPSKEMERNKNKVEDLEQSMESSHQDDLKEKEKDIATDQGKSNEEVVEGGSAETKTEKRNIFQMLQKHIGGDRKTGMMKTPVLKVIKEPAKNVEETSGGDSVLPASTTMSEATINKDDKADDGTVEEVVMEADEPSHETLFNLEEEIDTLPAQDFSSEQQKQIILRDVEPEKVSISQEADSVIPSDSAPEQGYQVNMDVEENGDGYSVTETMPQSQTLEDVDKEKERQRDENKAGKENKVDEDMKDMSGDKTEATGEKSSKYTTVEGEPERSVTNVAVVESSKVGEDGAEVTTPQNEEVSKSVEDVDNESSKIGEDGAEITTSQNEEVSKPVEDVDTESSKVGEDGVDVTTPQNEEVRKPVEDVDTETSKVGEDGVDVTAPQNEEVSKPVEDVDTESSKVGEDEVDVTAPQNEEVSKPVEDVDTEANKMSVIEGQPPELELFNVDDERGKSVESSDESTCMPIIVSVSSVTNGDGFLNPSALKDTQVEDAIHPEEGSVPPLGSFSNDQSLYGFGEGSSANEVSELSLPPPKEDEDPEQGELHDTSLDADESTGITDEPSGAGLPADPQNDGEVDIIDGISFMSFSTKEEILSYMNLRKSNKKGKSKKKSSSMTSVWAMSKKKKKPVKKTPPKPVHSIFPARPKEHSKKCIEDYEEKFLAELRKQKRNEILHPALLKRGVSIKRSLDCGIPLLIDLELLDVKLDEDIPRPEKDKNQSKMSKIAKEPTATPLVNDAGAATAKDLSNDTVVTGVATMEDLSTGKVDTDILTAEDLSNADVVTEDVMRSEEEGTFPSKDGESREQNKVMEESPKKNTSLEAVGNEDKSVSQEEASARRVTREEVLAKEHAVFKPFEKPVTSQKSAFFSSELDSYLHKLEAEKKGLLTSKSPKNKSKKPSKSRHMDKLNSAIQEISFSSLFKGKQKDSGVSSKTMDVGKKSRSSLLELQSGKTFETSKVSNTFVSPSVSKTRIGTTILKKSTAGSTRFRGPLPTMKESPKKNNKGITDLPPNTSIIYVVDGMSKQVPKRNRQSRFLDRLVSNVKKATEAEKKMSVGFSQGSVGQGTVGQGEKAPVDMSTIPLLLERTNDPTLGKCVSPNEVLPVRDSSSVSVKHSTSTADRGQRNLSSTSQQQIAEEKNPLEYFKEDPLSRDYDDLPGVTTECGNDFCRLGCVCSSLQTKLDEIPPEHCRKLECMLECNCERFPSLRILRARKRPAIFHQDGMVFYDGAGLLSEAADRKKRRLDPCISVDKSDLVQEKITTKKEVKPAANSAVEKQIEQKVEETEKATSFKPPLKLQRKEPGFARGRVYIAKHIRQAAKQEGQDQNDSVKGDLGSKNTVPPVKVVKTMDGYCVKPVTNVTHDTAAEEAVDESFKMLKRVDRMLFLSQRYRQKAQSHTDGNPKDSEQEKSEKSVSQTSQADNQSLSTAADVSSVSTNHGIGSSGKEARSSQDSFHATSDVSTKKPSGGMNKDQGEAAPASDHQLDGKVSKGQDKEADIMRNKSNSAQQSFTKENSVTQRVIGHQYLPADVEVLPDPSSGKTQPPASSETVPTSSSASKGPHSAKATQGLTGGTLSHFASQQSVNMTTGGSGPKSIPPVPLGTLLPTVVEKLDSVPTSQQVPGSQFANPKFRLGLTSDTSSKSAPPQRVTLTGGKIVQQQPHGVLLQKGHSGGQFISLPIQPPGLNQSKQLPVVLGQSFVPINQQQTLSPQPGGPSKNNIVMLPPKSLSVPTGAIVNPQLLRLPHKDVEGKIEKQLILIPQGKSVGTSVPGAVNKNTNYQAFWVNTSVGKAPVLLVPVQPKIPQQPGQSGILIMPSSEGTLSVADQLKMKREKAEQKERELQDCYGLKAFTCSQRGVIRPLRELAGYVTAHRRSGMDPTPFQKKQCLFIPNTHLMNPNKAFHLLIDVYSNCQWKQDQQCLFPIIFKMASKVRACESLRVNGYKVVRTSFTKHTQKAKSINVSSSVARNCTTKIRIIGLFQSEFRIFQVESAGNIKNPKTMIEVPARVETSQSTRGAENRNFGNQSRETAPWKQDGIGAEKGARERSEKKDGQGLRKKANILRTVRSVEHKAQIVHKPTLEVGLTSSPKSLIKDLGGVIVNPGTEKKQTGDKNSGKPSCGESEKTLPEVTILGELAAKETQEVSPLISAKQDSSSVDILTTGDVQECPKETREKKVDQGKESLEQSRAAKAEKATEAGIQGVNENLLEQPTEVPGTQEGENIGKQAGEGNGEDKRNVGHVRKESDKESTADLITGACDQSSEGTTIDLKDMIPNRTGERSVKSNEIREDKRPKLDEKEEGNERMAEIKSGSLQKTEGIESGEVYKDREVHKSESILAGKEGEETASVEKSDGKFQKGSDEMVKETAKSEISLSGNSESFDLLTKGTTWSQDKKPDGDDQSKDGNEVEMLPLSQEITGVQDQQEATALSSGIKSTLKDDNGGCILLDDGKKQLEDDNYNADDVANSGEDTKGISSEQQVAGGALSLHNLVAKLSNRMSDVVDDDDKEKSKDSNDVEILHSSQEITDVQEMHDARDLSLEDRSEQNESTPLQEKESEVIAKKDAAHEMKVGDTFISTSKEDSKLVSGREEKNETGVNKDVDTKREGKKETAVEDQSDDCIPLVNGKEEKNNKEEDNDKEKMEDRKNSGEDAINSKEDNKVSSEQQDADGNRPLHNVVTNLSNRVSDIGDEESKDGEKQQVGSADKQVEEVVLSSSSSSEDEVTSSDSDSGSESESVEEEMNQTSERLEWFEGARSCTLKLSTLIEKCFSGSVPFTAKWPDGYLDKTGWAEGTPKSKKVYETPFLDGCLSGKALAWPLKPKKKEVKFMSPDSLSNLYKKREEQKHEEKRQRAKRLAFIKRQSFKSLPPSQRLPKRDKVKSLEYCVVDKEPEISDEDVDVLGFDDDEYYSTDDDSIYTDSSYEDEQRSKNEALFSHAVIPSFAGRFRAILEKRGAIATPLKQGTSPESGVSSADRSEMQSPLVPEVRDQLFLKDTDFGSSGDESDSSVDVEKWSDSESQRVENLKESTKKSSDNLSYPSSKNQSLMSSSSKRKKRKGNVEEKRKGSISEKESFLSLCVHHSSDNESPSKKSDDHSHIRGPQKHEIHIYKERQRRAQQKKQFIKLGEAIFDQQDVHNKPKIAILKRAWDVIQIEKKKAKALDEELSAQRFCNYTLRTKIKNLLKKSPHLGDLMCNPVETPTVVENVAEKMVKEGSFPVPGKGSEGQQEKNSAFKHLLPEPTQPEPCNVAQSAQKLLGAMKMCMAIAADKKDSICHWTIQSMLDSGNEKLPSYLRTKEHMRKPTINFESEHYIISQKIQQERAARWRRKKRAMLRRESRLRIGSFINAKGSGGLVFTKGVTPFEKKQTLEKSSRRTNDEEDEESDSVNLSADSPASSLLDTIGDNESSKNNPPSNDGRGDDEDSLDGSLVCIAQVEEPEETGTRKKPSSEKKSFKKKKKSKKKNKASKKRKRSESSSEDEDVPSPFGAFVIDESLPSEGEDGWIDDELHPEDGWEEEEEMDESIGQGDRTVSEKTGENKPSVKAKIGDSERGKAIAGDEGRADPKEKDSQSMNQGSKQDPMSSDLSDINVDVRKIIPCLQVEEKDDGTLDVVLQGEFSDERLDELFARPGVMDYLRKAAAQKKKTKANDKPSGSGK